MKRIAAIAVAFAALAVTAVPAAADAPRIAQARRLFADATYGHAQLSDCHRGRKWTTCHAVEVIRGTPPCQAAGDVRLGTSRRTLYAWWSKGRLLFWGSPPALSMREWPPCRPVAQN
jgi:hypothetical protein